MKFTSRLEEGRLCKRYKRFFAEIDVGGAVITAHVPNTGSLKGVLEGPGQICYFSRSDKPERKLSATLELVRTQDGALVGVNTSVPNKIVAEALEARLFDHWSDIKSWRSEAKLNTQTRFDFYVEFKDGRSGFIEVKNTTMKVEDFICFPDAVTERGQKHLEELAALAREGRYAEIIFVLNRTDARRFRVAHEIDPVYAELLRKAHSAGVIITAAAVEISPSEVRLSRQKLMAGVMNVPK
ncbi:MAG: DNA/RNA nuclease SfsA [Bdellovibrionaceae bacterium]|nr:DNA/RNA nuclease SfsA [Pseudobdellovibrionaceae bacterium]